MFRFFALGVLALAAPLLHASSITYEAELGCTDTCVTVSLEWQNLIDPVSYVEVDDNLGDFLFSLNTPFPPETTGSILPDPQTVSDLTPDIVADITNGSSSLGGDASPMFQSLVSLAPLAPGFANLVLEDANHDPIATLRFVATVPEPMSLSLSGLGLGALFLLNWMRRRKLQNPA